MKVIIILAVFVVLSGKTVDGQNLDNASCEVYDCAQCYDLLVYNVLKSDVNRYNMQRAFFPPQKANPVYVIVYYNFEEDKIDNATLNIWFWTEYTFYNFQPIPVLQFTSLFFTDPAMRMSTLNITVDADCKNASTDFVQLLTQRVKYIAIALKCMAMVVSC